ncbi:leucine--tRNA ligase, cytoplasmic-like [Dermatophagoides farinae]|uniref:leucine--tRNA ligase, cytoplasmic-like n=1 Tax=Dermatophagoides farinae TaxID=6954 RepID=UPI003F619A77
MLTNQENIGEPPFETEASKAKRKLRKRLLKQFKREGRLDLVENIDEELEKYMQNEKSALNIETDFKTKISDSTSASEATVANEYETHHETEEEESNEVKITASNVGIISTFICITQQIQALTEQKESLLPFIPKEIIEKVTKRKRRASSQLIIVPKKRKFTLLRERNKIKYGIRSAIFSTVEFQPCADHDRSSGEGVVPESIPLCLLKVESDKIKKFIKEHVTRDIKIYLLVNFPIVDEAGKISKEVYFSSLNKQCAYYGYSQPIVPNVSEKCDKFVSYFEMSEEEIKNTCDIIYICDRACARNLAFQGRMPVCSNIKQPLEITVVPFEALIGEKFSSDCAQIGSLTGASFATKETLISASGALLPIKDQNKSQNAFETNKIDISKYNAFNYYYTNTPVISRSGSECVVALCNQWYLDYGDIYGSIPGSLNIKAKDLSVDVFNYIYLQTDSYPNTKIPRESLDLLRKTFEYWYPMTLRCSGKDLVTNHLTMSLFNHAAIWPERPDLWPKRFFINGHVMLDQQKMSKQTGNFLTMQEAHALYGADSTRLALAEAGDFCENANFERNNATNALLKISLLSNNCTQFMNNETLRKDVSFTIDKFFIAQVDINIIKTKAAYENLLFRDVLKFGFYEMLSLRTQYLIRVKSFGEPSYITLYHWWSSFLVMMSPIIPHITDHIWRFILNKETSIVKASWPEPYFSLSERNEYNYKFHLCEKLIADSKKALQKSAKFKEYNYSKVLCVVSVTSSYNDNQKVILSILRNLDFSNLPEDVIEQQKHLLRLFKKESANLSLFREMPKQLLAKLMSFASLKIKEYLTFGDIIIQDEISFDELEMYAEHRTYLEDKIEKPIEFFTSDGSDQYPGSPLVTINLTKND